jgi:tetratricopeptide (TPR) repeat protein
LEEGYANVFTGMAFTDKGANLGRPDHDDLSVLWQSPLLPLDLVFRVDRNSGYYNPGSKRTVYFAESRMLVRYLLTDPMMSGKKSIERYIALVNSGADALQAARQAFGDLDELHANLESYFKRSASAPSDVPGGGASEAASAPRTLSPAETAARMGDFALNRGRIDSAQTKLEEAIKLDPSLASAEVSLGYLLLRQNQVDEAEKHFTRAVQLDQNNALAYYGQGRVSMARGGSTGVPAGAAVAFEKTVSLNADFAPAWFNLASVYAARPETMQKALDAARRAASLAPGEPAYQRQLAAVLANLGQTEEARKVAELLGDSSSDFRASGKGGDLLAQITQARTTAPSAAANAPPVTASADRSIRIERKTEPDDRPAETPSNRTREETYPEPPPPAPVQSSRIYSMVGTISEVSCTDSPQIQITLKALTIVMHLHAADVAKLAIKTSGSGSLAKNAVCTGLRGRNVRVSYLLVPDKTWDGEIQSIEFR